MHEYLATIVKQTARKATKLNPRKVRDIERLSITGSHFGGNPYAESGEDWPVCPTCKTSLTFICQVDTTTGIHQKPQGIDLYTFFYCWECSPWGLSDEAKGTWVVRTYSEPSDAKAIRLLPHGKEPEPTEACEVVAENVLSFPDWDDLEFWSKDAATVSRAANPDEPWEVYISTVEALGGVADYSTVIGGYPSWIQGEATPRCDLCGHLMGLLAQIGSEDEANIMWGDAGCVYLFYCAEHPREIKLELQCF